ncbi:metal-dependent transcriptional regulator [Christiangramia forsetii]|uniref:Transcriptional regulator MntR n=2 Tax=Christiangramia forsetii TaxID=411153 RepID=A0M6A3_CHRFK|nr:metal-dependent transcriptional regulator [Christiangramia forsetii]GGG30982.1 iron-dependent repressor [Christiangramia forsetii]CAL68148.1 iron dependent repressor [Christiangramia forsetii KT0803]
MFSLSEENYLKAIFHLETAYKNGVSTNALAEEMQTKASSVTDMIKRLSDKALVNYKKYQGVKLSSEGKQAAIEVIRKHRLWEVFLVEKLGFNWDEVHEVAEQLEHIKSEKLTNELDKFLEYPKKDPHGDPIPDAKGNFSVGDRILLSALKKGETGICVGVKDSSADFLQYLDKNKISLGKKIQILEKEDFDQSMLIKMDGNELMISNQISTNLFIKTI